MPIYEYKCIKCGEEFERLTAVSDKKMPECIKCGSLDTKKMFSVFGFASSGRSSSSSGAACGTCSSNNCSTCGG